MTSDPTPLAAPKETPPPAVNREAVLLSVKKVVEPLFAENESAGNFIVTIGTKHNGKKLSELTEQALAWYAGADGKGMAPVSEKTRQLQAKASRYIAEKSLSGS